MNCFLRSGQESQSKCFRIKVVFHAPKAQVEGIGTKPSVVFFMLLEYHLFSRCVFLRQVKLLPVIIIAQSHTNVEILIVIWPSLNAIDKVELSSSCVVLVFEPCIA